MFDSLKGSLPFCAVSGERCAPSSSCPKRALEPFQPSDSEPIARLSPDYISRSLFSVRRRAGGEPEASMKLYEVSSAIAVLIDSHRGSLAECAPWHCGWEKVEGKK